MNYFRPTLSLVVSLAVGFGAVNALASDLALFEATVPDGKRKLFVTDGTTAGTRLANTTLYAVYPKYSIFPSIWKVNGYAVASDGINLYSIDRAGVFRPIDKNSGEITFLLIDQGKLYYSNGVRIRYTDGTLIGTKTIATVPTGTSIPSLMKIGTKRILFYIERSRIGTTFRVLGSPSQTSLRKGILATPVTMLPAEPTRMVFACQVGGKGRVCLTNGTASGTSVIASGPLASATDLRNDHVVVGGRTLVRAVNPNGTFVILTDGTPNGTVQFPYDTPVTNLRKGCQIGEKYYFGVYSGIGARSNLYEFDVKSKKAKKLSMTIGGSEVNVMHGVDKFRCFGSAIYFEGFASNSVKFDTMFYKYDVSNSKTTFIFNTNKVTPPSDPSREYTDYVTGFVRVGNYYVFGADDYRLRSKNHDNVELWRTDGTTSGTTLIKEIIPGREKGGNMYYVIPLGD